MCLALCVAMGAVMGAAIAQPPGFTTKLLLKSSYSPDSSKEAIVSSAELAPGASTVLEGQLEVQADGQETRIVKAGESYHNAKGVVHESRNPGTKTTKLLSTFIIDKGQRLVEPVE